MCRNIRQQMGSALISALFIMSLIAIAATAMILRVQLEIYHTRLVITTDKLNLASELVLFWGINELRNKDNTFSIATSSGLVKEFPTKLANNYPPFKLSGALYDLQSRFNINNISDPNYFLALLRLLDSPQIQLGAKEKKQLLATISLWISPYRAGQDKEGFLQYYLQQKPPYLPAHQLLQSISELRLLQGVDAKLYNSLIPLLSALPEVTPLNINTMPPHLLTILGYGLDKDKVAFILRKRGETGITRPEELLHLLKHLKIPPQQATITSQYFLCIASVQGNGMTRLSYTLLKRQLDKQGRPSVFVLSESLNAL